MPLEARVIVIDCAKNYEYRLQFYQFIEYINRRQLLRHGVVVCVVHNYDRIGNK